MFDFFFHIQGNFITPDTESGHTVSSRCVPLSILEALFVIVYENLDFAAQKENDNEVADDTCAIEEIEGRPQCLGCSDSTDNSPGTTDGIVNLDPCAFKAQGVEADTAIIYVDNTGRKSKESNDD